MATPDAHTVGLLIVAAGSSRRMDGIDKLWTPLGGKPVVRHALDTLAPYVDRVVLVVRAADMNRARDELKNISVKIVNGGADRRHSVLAGLTALAEVDLVAVHDAARPLVRPETLLSGLRLLEHFDAAVPGIPLSDTIKRVDAQEVIQETIERGDLRAVQTPQVFRHDTLAHAHARRQDGNPVTDDAQLVEEFGGNVVVFPGDPQNIKITTQHDLQLLQVLMSMRQVPHTAEM